MTNPNEELPVVEVFENWHAIGVIACIDRDDGNIKKEIMEKVDLSGDPLRELLDDAIEADLVTRIQWQDGDHGRANRYQLTERGRAIQSLLREQRFDLLQRALVNAKSELKTATGDVQEMIKEENLHMKYPKKDSWEWSGSEPPDVNTEQPREEVEESKEYYEPEKRRRDWSVEGLTDEVDLGEPDETWGDTSEEENGQEE